MASSERKHQLETLLSDTFGSAFESVRRSLTAELQRHVETRERTAREEAHRTLREACARLDSCSRQTELLAAFLEEAGRFASRTALWIVSPEGAQGWAGYGFEDEAPAIETLEASWDETPWNAVAPGGGWVEVLGDDAVALGESLGVAPPERAMLVPLVLRDRIAAVLYADRLPGDEPFVPEALQVLALTAALLLEVQGLRQRERTPTLHPAGAGGPSLELWEGGPPRRERPPEVVPEAEPIPPPEPAAAPTEAAPAVAEVEIEAEVEPEPAAAEEDLWAEEAEALPEADVEAIPPAEEEIGEEAYEPADIEGFEVEELPEAEIADLEEPLEEPEVDDETTARIPSEPVGAEPTVRVSQEMIDEARERGLAPPVEAEEPETETAEEVVPPSPPPPPRPAPGGSTEVSAPPDLEGPGLAFRPAEAPSRPAADEETVAVHEEARRLARLLVSEIKLYNEEEVEAGRHNNDIYQRLQEDIDRSRQMYRERVDPRVRDDVDYFHQELVNILGGGDPDALGI